MKKVSIVVGLVSLLLSASAGAKAPRLHLDVETAAGKTEQVALPLEGGSPFGQALSRAQLNGSTDADVATLKKAWEQVTRSGGAYTIALDSADARLAVSEHYGTATIQKTPFGTTGKHVTVELPAAAMDALLAGAGSNPDFDGALRALQQRGKGEAIAVEGSDGGKVRIWID